MGQERTESFTAADFLMGQFVGEGDRVSMKAEDQWNGHLALQSRKSEAKGNGDSGDRLCGIKVTVENFVPHGGPAEFARELHLNPMTFKDSRLLGDGDGSAIGEWYEAETDRLVGPGAC